MAYSRDDLNKLAARPFNLIDNYLYMYHLDKFVLLPTYPESIQDTLSATFSSTSPISRSAPIFTYSYSGPRTIQVNLALHRDMMQQINYGVSNLTDIIELGDDYVDTMVKQLQAIALPKYSNSTSTKMVDPPLVAIRFGQEVYIKGVVNGGITVTYHGPIGIDNKYKQVDISFQVSEVDPYDAQTILSVGSFRGLNKTLERRIYKS